jgi:hypothetical protein
MSYEAGSADRDQYDVEQSYAQRSRRRLYAVIIAMLVMAVSGGGVWLLQREGAKRIAGGEAPLIQADPRAVKTRPEQPGGMKIPNQETMVYNPGRGSGQVEHLLPPPETPIARPVAPPPEPTTAAVAPAAEAPPAPPVTAPVVPPVVAAPTPPVAIAPSPPVAAAPPAPPPQARGAYRLQIGALRSEEAARLEWDRLKRIHGDLLGGMGAVTARADLGERGIYFRIQAGPIADTTKAEKICAELKRRNVGCILVRS